MRSPLEEVDPTVFEELQADDFLFIDSSHRTFTNSDVTILFHEFAATAVRRRGRASSRQLLAIRLCS